VARLSSQPASWANSAGPDLYRSEAAILRANAQAIGPAEFGSIVTPAADCNNESLRLGVKN